MRLTQTLEGSNKIREAILGEALGPLPPSADCSQIETR